MRKTAIILLTLVLAVAWQVAASAATADFQGDCTGRAPTFCVLDASRTSSSGSGTSCGSASISLYHWNFGDGDSAFTSSSSIGHVYEDIDVYSTTLTVFCSDSSSANRTICVNTFPIGAFGCIHPFSGWQP